DQVLERLAPSPAPVAVANSRLAGVPSAGGRAAVDGDPATVWQTAFGPAKGATITVTEPASLSLDHLDLQVLADGKHSVPTSLVVSNGTERRAVTLPAIADRAGSAAVSVPISFPTLSGDHFTVTITGTRDLATIDRESEQPVVLPVGIAELGLPRPSAAGR